MSPLDEKNLAFLVTASQFYRYLHEEPCGYCLIFQLIAFSIRPKSISFEQSCYKRSQTIIVTSLQRQKTSSFFSVKKQRPLKRISKSATNVVLALTFL